MSKKLLRGVLVDVEKETVSVVEIPDELDEFYRILNCSCIDIVSRRIGKNKAQPLKRYNIVCDDEGLYKDPQKISAIDNMGQVQLVGNLFIVGGADQEGNLTSLWDSDVMWILDKVQKIGTRKFPAGYPMLTQCEY